MRQALQILGESSPNAESIRCKTPEEESAANIQAKKTSNAGAEEKGEKGRSEGHRGSGIDYGVKLMH